MSQLLQNAFYGTALILAAALLRRALKDRLLPEARLALWAACLFRLLTPVAPESMLSFWGLFQSKTQPAAPLPGTTGYLPAPGAYAPAPQPASRFPWETLLLAAWLAVGLALAVRYVLNWRRTRRAVAAAIPLGPDDPRYLPLPKCARLREGPMEGAPLTFGVARPTVVLSPGLEGEDLLCVLAHEGVHARRRDNLWHYVMAAALALHWWNPAVWLMARLLRRDVELSCDRAALRALGPDKRAQYASALLTLATQGDGPAFCQTFGRKAAEERILSIMKFKKTSIIGVIFSLALVLAVSVAFASEPKEPLPDAVTFHGETYSRDQLSQETLDWLDWYLALSEEEQLAISYVPAELRPNRTYGIEDAHPDEDATTSSTSAVRIFPNPEKTKELTSDFPEVDPDNVDLSMMKERLAQRVASGELTQEEADAKVYELERMLEEAREGTVKLFIFDNGDIYSAGVFTVPGGEDKTIYQDPSDGLRQLYRDVDGLQTPGDEGMYFRSESGQLTPMDPGSVSSAYVVPDPAGVEDKEPGGEVGSALYDYAVSLPTFDEDGNSVAADGGIVGVRTSSGSYPLCDGADCGLTWAHYHQDGQAIPVSYLDPGKGYDDYTIVGYDENGYPLDGDGNRLVFDENGRLFMKVSMGYGPCVKDDCTVSGEHYHKDGEVIPFPESNAPTPVFEPALDNVPVRSPYCPVCTETRLHRHTDGQTILLDDPCPVGGCAILGEHTHGGVHYSCNGAGHEEGHCDGSCYSQPAAPAGTYLSTTHHTETHHSNHH